jgi:Flp pilus assembly protein CpaB
MNARALIPLVAGLGIGGLALKLGVDVLQNAKAGQNNERVQIWGARGEIPRGTAIDADMLQSFAYPSDVIPAGAFREKDKLVGRVARLVIPAGLPVLDALLAPANAKAGVFPPAGFRAIAVKIDESSGVDYHLEPGCFVDVIGSTKDRRAGGAKAKTIVDNVEVAAVGERISPEEKPGAEGGKKAKDKGRPVRAVTLYVRPDQAKRVLLAEQEGPIKLCLRGSSDQVGSIAAEPPDKLEQLADENAENQGAAAGWLQTVFAQFKPSAVAVEEVPLALVAAAPGPEPWILKIYRGNERETVQFKSRDSCERVSEQSESSSEGLFGNRPHAKVNTGRAEPSAGAPVSENPPPAGPSESENPPPAAPNLPPETQEPQE